MKALLADPKPNIRYGLMVLLGEQPDLEIVGETANYEELLKQIQTHCPDLVLLSWELLGNKVGKRFSNLREICPELYLIVLSGKSNLRETILKAGADDFICKGDSPEKLLAAVQNVYNLKASRLQGQPQPKSDTHRISESYT